MFLSLLMVPAVGFIYIVECTDYPYDAPTEHMTVTYLKHAEKNHKQENSEGNKPNWASLQKDIDLWWIDVEILGR